MAAEDYYDLYYEPYEAFNYEDEGVTCKYCGESELIWEQVNGRWKLFDPETEQFHDCKSFDIFNMRK